MNSKNSGKYLSNDWDAKRQRALRDLDQRERLTDFEKDYIELTYTQIGSQDPERTYIEVMTGTGEMKRVKNKNY